MLNQNLRLDPYNTFYLLGVFIDKSFVIIPLTMEEMEAQRGCLARISPLTREGPGF